MSFVVPVPYPVSRVGLLKFFFSLSCRSNHVRAQQPRDRLLIMIAVSAASAEHRGMAKGAALATAFIALVALGRAQLPSRYEQAPTAPTLAGKIEK